MLRPSESDHLELEAAGIVLLLNSSAGDDQIFEGAFCGGVVASEDVVITASHCVEERAAGTVDVATSVGNVCESVFEERARVIDMRVGLGPNGDLAVLRLAGKVQQKPAAFASEPPGNGDRLTALGWGRRSVAGVPACELKSVSLKTVPAIECSRGNQQRHDVVCSLPLGSENSCDGDSGGPVLLGEGSTAGVVAITMSGFGCSRDSAGINALLTQDQVTDLLDINWSQN